MSPTTTACHHSASLVMPIGDPRDQFFYLTLMMNSYRIKHSFSCINICQVMRKMLKTKDETNVNALKKLCFIVIIA